MKQQVFNPYLPSYEYIPDGEPHLFNDRVYIYGSHDAFNGKAFCVGDYICYSAPKDDLSDWKFEGVIYQTLQTPGATKKTVMWAPDVTQGTDGRFYLYFFVHGSKGKDNSIHVAVCQTPAGKYEYLGEVKYQDGTPVGQGKDELKSFDPGVFRDEDGKVYLYSGFSPLHRNPFITGKRKPSDKGSMCYRLSQDMLTVEKGPDFIGVPGKKTSLGTGYEGHEFFEASSMRKFNGTYYFIYSSFIGHELCYATSKYPDHGFEFKGTLVSIGDIGLGPKNPQEALNYTGNTHGSILNIADDYYVFYHRQTNLYQYSRQACAEKLTINKDGLFSQAEITSCGLNNGPLKGVGRYEARIACNLNSSVGAKFYWVMQLKLLNRKHPYFTQYGKDREDTPNQHIANFNNGCWCAFKYFDLNNPKSITVSVKGKAAGVLTVSTSKDGQPIAQIGISKTNGKYQDFSCVLKPVVGILPLYFSYKGSGRFDFMSFELKD